MRRSSWVGVLAAGALLVAGCSSSGGTPAPGTSSTSSSQAAGASAGSSSGAADSSVAPADLDGQTTAWFEKVCDGLGPSLQSLNSLDQTAVTDPAAAQQAAVTALQTLQTAFSSTAAQLASQPPPTFDGGADFAGTLTAGLASAGTQLETVATKFAAVNPTDTTALKAATTTLQTDLTTALQPLESINQLDPSVSSAVAELPACKALGN